MATLSPIARVLKIHLEPRPLTGSAAAFLWGPRQTGKSTLLQQLFPRARLFDLLESDVAAELAVRPALLREQILAERPAMVIIDEIQKIPVLMEEVHWLLEHTSTQFVLCGSSARKLRREAHNLLGGRAVEKFLLPLTSSEIPEMDLEHTINTGLLPVHYLAKDARPMLKAYVNNYIKEEIIDEAATRNVPAFSRFLQAVGLTHGRLLNYANSARECGVSTSTVRAYYQILIDTLLGFELAPWRKTKTRRLIETAKFYVFDIGVANYLTPEVERVSEGSDLFGRGFEHFVLNEIRAYLAYNERDLPLTFWRTSSGFEVDLIVGQLDLAVECKAAERVRAQDLKGLRALLEEHRVKHAVVVSREPTPRRTEDGIDILPWRHFCEQLWGGEMILP